MADPRYQVQRRTLLTLAQYERMQDTLPALSDPGEPYFILSHRFGSLKQQKGDLRIRWSGPQLNEWNSYEVLHNTQADRGDIYRHLRLRRFEPCSKEHATGEALELIAAGMPHDPHWVKHIQKYKTPELVLSLQHMWGAVASFGYILETYATTPDPSKEQAILEMIDHALQALSLQPTPTPVFQRAIEDIVERNATHNDTHFPAIARPRPALDDTVMQDWVRRGIVPEDYLGND